MLEKLRIAIDQVDEDILSCLEKRAELVRQMAVVKKEQNLPIFDKNRESRHIAYLQKHVDDFGVKQEVQDLFNVIMRFSRSIQNFHYYDACPFSSVAVVGLGLVGSSIVQAISAKDKAIKIYGVDPKPPEKSLPLHQLFQDVENLPKVDCLIIATPISTIVSIAKRAKKARCTPLIIDVGSAKEQIAIEFNGLSDKTVDCVPTHPMAGGLQKGSAARCPYLFAGKPWVLTPLPKSKAENIQSIERFIQYLGAKPVVMSAKEHDQDVSIISHLPKLLSMGLQATAEKVPTCLQIAGKGYERSVAAASGNPELIEQIFHSNFANIYAAWLAFSEQTESTLRRFETDYD
jgi:prephenate dehydrogenase